MSGAAKATLSVVVGLAATALVALMAVGLSCGFDVDSGQLECGPSAECPRDFECRFDGRCYRPDVGLSTSCGNNIVEANETCDPRAGCATDCDDGNRCTVDNLVGDSADCNVGCLRAVIEECVDGDECCPEGCGFRVDDDCSATCGNDVVDDNETCDPPATCPAVCDDGNKCTEDVKIGSAANCNVTCATVDITTCGPEDGCCPAGCDSGNDGDCSATCGNSVIDPGEKCDPPSSCPTDPQTDCDDNKKCTIDGLTGSAANCNAECTHQQIVTCTDNDECCPVGCEGSDNDCGGGQCNNDMFCDFPDETPLTCAPPTANDCFGCGDGYCDTLIEDSSSCMDDCMDECGDMFCDYPTEDNASCSLDCFCGDGFCYPPEDGAACAEDCGGSDADGGP